MMNNEAEKIAGIAHHNPILQVIECTGNPRYISVQSFYTIKNGEKYIRRFNKLPLLPDPFHFGKEELWVNPNGYIEKIACIDSLCNIENKSIIDFETYRYEAFFDDKDRCIHCERVHRNRKDFSESKNLYDFEYENINGKLREKIMVCTDVQKNKKSTYTYQYDENGDLVVFDIEGHLNKFIVFTYTDDHILLAKEERDILKQTDLFEGGSVFSKGTYYKYDPQNRLVSIEENDRGKTTTIKHIVYFENGTTKTTEKGFLGESLCTWNSHGEGCHIRNICIKRQSPTISIVTQTDTTNDETGNQLLKKCYRLTYRFNRHKREWKTKREEWEKRFEYVFDKKGNWIQREEFLDGKSIRVTQRVIEYW